MAYLEDDEATAVSRKQLLLGVRRVVVKVGSAVLSGRDGLSRKVLYDLSDDIYALWQKGIEVALVSSGAIASGMKKIGLAKRPDSISQKQAVAAVGQCSLMLAWEKAFARHGQKVAQILITRDDFNHRGRYLNARNTIFTLLSWRIIPIINENDTVVAEEIKFGDNDSLSAMVTDLLDAHFLVLLTNEDGLYDQDPRRNGNARLIKVVGRVSRETLKYAASKPGSLGTGGMESKIRAGQKASMAGVPAVIANGSHRGVLREIFKGKDIGTLILPQDVNLCSRKRWIAFTKAPKGQLVVDRGAEKALLGGGKSLLPSGIREVRGQFNHGDSVVVVNEWSEELGVGMVNYDSGDIRKIMGLKTTEIESTLGFRHDDEVIHRDNLVITRNLEEGEAVCR
jgi:glutamate 5-kinase